MDKYANRINALKKRIAEASSPEEKARTYTELAKSYILKASLRSDAVNARDAFMHAGLSKEEAEERVLQYAKSRFRFPVAAEMYAERGEHDKAGEYFRKDVIHLWPKVNFSLNMPDAEVALRDSAEEYKKAGSYEKAAESMAATQPNSLTTASLYEQAGRYDKAIKILKKWPGEERKISKLEAKLKEQKTGGKKLSSAIVSVISIGSFLAGLFFLSSNVTGNAIADLSAKTNSILGAGLLVVGLVAGFFWLKSRKK